MGKVIPVVGRSFSVNLQSEFVPLLILAVLFSSSLPAIGVELKCNDALVPATDSTPYQKRDNRCEGIYSEKKVTGATLALIGFTRGLFYYDLKDSENIQLSVPVDIPDEFTPIQISGLPYSVNVYYKMDSLIAGRESLSWPVRDVLLPENLVAETISVYGVFKHPGNADIIAHDIHIPLRAASAGISSHNDDTLRLYLSASQDIDYLRSEWSCDRLAPWNEDEEKVHRGSAPIRIFPPIHLHGKCHVRFVGYLKKRDSGGEGNQVTLELLVHLGE